MSTPPSADSSRIVVGHISGAHGVRGWLRVHSYTDPPPNILDYGPWYLEQGGETRQWELLEARQNNSGLLVRLRGCEDRDRAERLKGAIISVERARLPALAEGEYYWHDLMGLRVEGIDGRTLGTVRDVMETGANDVLIVAGEAGGEILIPYISGQVIRDVDLDNGRLVVDWDPDY